MPIEPHAAPDEIDSPFFIANEKICQTFDQFINEQGGKTRGKYNAYSYHIFGNVKHANDWEFQIKKSSFNASPTLFNSHKNIQFVASTWTARHLSSDCPKFQIRKKKGLDFIGSQINKNLNELSGASNYVINCKNPNHELIHDLIKRLFDLFQTESVTGIQYDDTVLKIELISDNTYIPTIKKLLAKNYY